MEENHTNLILEYGREIAIASLPVDILLSVVLVVGIVGNVFVIFIFATKMRKDQRGSRYFIPIVAFCDLLVCVLSLIYFISTTLHWTTFRSDELCKTMTFFLVQTMMISDAFLLAISVQRFIKICRPTAKQMTLYWRRITVVLVIITNTLYSIPTAVVSGVQDSPVVYRNVNITGEGCSTTNNKYPLFQLIYYGVVMFILVTNIVATCGLYTPIACIIYRRSRSYRLPQRTETNVPSSETSGQPRTNFNLMFFVIITVYALSYLPTAIMITYVILDDTIWATSSYGEIRTYKFFGRTYIFNHVANPFIYAYFDSAIRSHMTCSFCPSSKTWPKIVNCGKKTVNHNIM